MVEYLEKGLTFLLLIAWAWRENKALKEREHQNRVLDELSRERDDLRTANHRLGKSLPELERRYQDLEAWARDRERPGGESEFSAELLDGHTLFTAMRRQLSDSTGRVDAKTGIAALDSAIAYVAQSAGRAQVSFDCRVLATAKGLLALPGMSELALHQLWRNLLDNALHAATQSDREPRMVQCVMGTVEGHYRIDVYDSGDPFPDHILRRLGRMGNTTDGTGVGLVEVLNTLKTCSASLFITHFDEPLGTGAMKRVTVCFDGETMAHLPPSASGGPADVSVHSLLEQGGCEGKREGWICTKS